GLTVPDVLLSGDHARIEEYRFLDSVSETLNKRPELLRKVAFTTSEKKQLRQAGLFSQVQQAQQVTVGQPQDD
ncbi:MAG: hypothetical protein WBM35_05550, partial [Candidatus Electrothrix sp.]